jgi:hypothetical protein
MTQVRGSSNAKAKRELGWTPRYRSYRDGFASALADARAGEVLTTPTPDRTANHSSA